MTTIEQELRGARHIGDVIMWRARGGVQPDALKAALDEHGLDEIKAPEILGIGAFRLAVREVARANGLKAEVQLEDAGALVFALVESAIESDAGVGDSVGTIANRVLWRKVPRDGEPQVVFRTDYLEGPVLAKYEYHATHLSSRAMRELIASTLRSWGAVGMHSKGGIYWLAAAQAGKVRALREALRCVGSDVFVMPQPDLGDTRAALSLAAARQLGGQVEALRAEARKWSSGERKPRESTLHERLDQYRAMRLEIETLVDALDLSADDLRVALDELTDGCKVMLGIEHGEGEGHDNNVTHAESVTDGGQGDDIDDGGQDTQGADNVEQGSPEGVTEQDGDNGRPGSGRATPNPPSRPTLPDGLEQKTVAELRTVARSLNLRTARLNKTALVAAIRAAQGDE